MSNPEPQEGAKGPEEGANGPEEGAKGPEEGAKGPEEGAKEPEEGAKEPEERALTTHAAAQVDEHDEGAETDNEILDYEDNNSTCSSCESPNESDIEELVRNLNQEHGSFSWVSLGIRTGFHFAWYPTQMSQILMQSGYEPFPPRRSVTLLGRPCLLLPSALQYLKYIYQVDGIQGCFRGTFPRLIHQIAYTQMYHTTRRILGRRYIRAVVARARFREAEERQDRQSSASRRQSQNDDSEVSESSGPGFSDHFREVFHDLSAKIATILVTYPLHVVVIRSIAKFVGQEYLSRPSILGEIKAIYADFGILGFYRGIIPKVLGETCQTLIVGALAFFVSNQAPGIEVRSMLNLSFSVLVSAWTYQFNVVSTTMAINGSSLMLGQPPIHPIRYDNWMHCWQDLSRRNILSRGSSIICRYYTGPTRLVNGIKEPIDVSFGPNHLPMALQLKSSFAPSIYHNTKMISVGKLFLKKLGKIPLQVNVEEHGQPGFVDTIVQIGKIYMCIDLFISMIMPSVVDI